jgi:hypothetical protein
VQGDAVEQADQAWSKVAANGVDGAAAGIYWTPPILHLVEPPLRSEVFHRPSTALNIQPRWPGLTRAASRKRRKGVLARLDPKKNFKLLSPSPGGLRLAI